MAFQLSPSVSVTETDLTNIIPVVATSTGATVGQFLWGPVDEIQVIDSEDELVSVFGKPTTTIYKDFLCTSSFLAYASGLKVVRVVDGDGALNATGSASAGTSGQLIKNGTVHSNTSFTASTDLFIAKYPGALGNSVGVAFADTDGFNAVDSAGDKTWPWASLFTDAPGTNEFHIVVYDADGGITGTTDQALEIFPFVSDQPGAVYFDGSSAYFENKINNDSAWIWIAKASLLEGTSDGFALAGGADGSAIADGDRNLGFDLFKDPETTDISLVFQAGGSVTVGKYVIDNIAETRKDCLALVSVEEDDVVNVFAENTALTNILATRNTYGSSSYAVMDSAYKYTYDKYNDVFRWIPLNGDIAGIIARTDNDYDPWFSPAGYNKGRIKNAIKLSTIQSKSFRDEIYKKGINPCNVFSVEGAVLFGDKTLLSKPSAFDRINVRRLFTTLEKAIATAGRYMLFEQNDDFTRTQFVNMVEPFLRDVQGRRGITDFRVICDKTNNTAEVVDRNEFTADIYIKPVRSTNFIRLNFVAVRTGVSFEEVVVTGEAPNTGAGAPIRV